jgi:ribosomal protein S18 acetylase RimI-like enzyme
VTGQRKQAAVGDLTLRHHDARQAREIADELATAYREAYLGTPQEHDPFYSSERFAERFRGYTSASGFELVTAHAGDQLAGYVFGYALPPGARWWNGLLDPVPEGFTDETGTRTFALNELHVRSRWRGRGVASRLHAELLAHRREERATILVRPDNPARSTYLHWGYRVVGRLQPYPDSPVYDALVLDLRKGRTKLAV